MVKYKQPIVFYHFVDALLNIEKCSNSMEAREELKILFNIVFYNDLSKEAIEVFGDTHITDKRSMLEYDFTNKYIKDYIDNNIRDIFGLNINEFLDMTPKDQQALLYNVPYANIVKAEQLRSTLNTEDE